MAAMEVRRSLFEGSRFKVGLTFVRKKEGGWLGMRSPNHPNHPGKASLGPFGQVALPSPG